MAIRKSKKIRQVAPGRGKITNTEGQVGDVKTMCYVIAEHDILERTDGHGDTTSLLVLGCDWTGLELIMGTLHQWLNRTFGAVAEMALVTGVAEMPLDAAVAEQAGPARGGG